MLYLTYEELKLAFVTIFAVSLGVFVVPYLGGIETNPLLHLEMSYKNTVVPYL